MNADPVEERAGPGVLREVSVHTPALLFTADAAGNVDSVNARWAWFIGANADEMLGTGWRRFVHPEDVGRILRLWSRQVTGARPYVSQWRFRRGDGTYRWTEIRAEALRDATGRVLRWYGAATDVDVLRRAIEALDFLAEVGVTVAGAQDVAAVLDRLARAALEGLADISIFDLEEDDGTSRRLVVAAPEVPESTVELTRAFAAPRRGQPHPIARAMMRGETVHVPYVDEPFIQRAIAPPERQEAWRRVDIRSMVVAPMTVPGRVLGALTLLRTGTSVPFEAPDVRVIEEVARRAAVAIENVRLKEREADAARDLRLYADMSESLAEALGLQQTLDAAMHAIVPARADWAYVKLADENGELRLVAAYHPDGAKRRELAAHTGEPFARAGGLEVPLFAGAAVRGAVHVCVDDDRAFTGADVEFFGEFARRLARAIAHAELFERERRVATSFQDAALPSTLPNVPHFAFDAIYEAGRAEALVGGDWYDAFVLADGRIVVSIGDVSGSGLSAAVTMAGVRQAIRGAAHVRADPDVMLDAAERAFDDPERRFVTAFVGVIDPDNLTITYQSAGHPAPLLRSREGSLVELAATGMPLGLRAAHPGRPSRSQVLTRSSLLVLYTDGLIESTHDILAGEDALRAALRGDAVYGAENPAKMLHDLILTNGSRDDVAILTVKVD